MLQKAEEKQVVKYSVVEADIAQMKSIYMDLAITDLEDDEQFKQVKEARLIVKGKRCAVENERKALKKESLAWGKKVDTRAREIFTLIEPIESHLQAEEQKVIDEQERIKAEEAAKEKAMLEKRFNDLFSVGYTSTPLELAVLGDDEFQCLLDDKTFAFNEEQEAKAEAGAKEKKRLADEEAARKAEADRLAKQKAEQDAKAEKLQKEKDALAKEKRELAAEKQAMREQKLKSVGVYRAGTFGESLTSKHVDFQYHWPTWNAINAMSDDYFYSLIGNITVEMTAFEIEKEAAEKQATENARIKAEADAKAKAEQDAKDAEDAKIAAKEAEGRRVALLPDKEKLTEWVHALKIPDMPDFKSPEVLEIGRVGVAYIELTLHGMLKEVEEL